MLDSITIGYVTLPFLVLAFFLQIITINHYALRHKELAKAGKRLMAAGFLIAILRYTLIPYFPVVVLGLILIGAGSMFTCLERFIGMVEWMKYREACKRIHGDNRAVS